MKSTLHDPLNKPHGYNSYLSNLGFQADNIHSIYDCVLLSLHSWSGAVQYVVPYENRYIY